MSIQRLAIVVPGILGSALYSPRRPVNLELWGENLYSNYVGLIDQPGLLEFRGTAAHARIIKKVFISNKILWPKASLYDGLIERLLQDSEFGPSSVLECAYDWRDSILNSSDTIVASISKQWKLDLRATPSSTEPKLVLFTHSLGGLVVRAAVAKGTLNPDRIDRLIHIGTPLRGSPSAFRTAFSKTDLPMFDELFRFLRVLRREDFKAMLLASFRTFPSVFQLMPHADIRYLFYSPLLRGNPLAEDIISKEMLSHAREGHDAVRGSDLILFQRRVPVFTIYTEACARKKTDYEYRVKAIARPASYEILGVHHSDFTGDGTVPSYSAMGSDLCKRVPLADVKHAQMCSSRHVINSAMKLLDTSATEMST